MARTSKEKIKESVEEKETSKKKKRDYFQTHFII